MVKTEASIKKKWGAAIEVMKKKAEIKYAALLERRRKWYDRMYEYAIEKNERKKRAYIRKKELEYKRKMLNEIRVLKDKPPRVYKLTWAWSKINPLQFALKIAQENSRLRDTNEEWIGRCISCNRLFHWEWLAGGHRYSRKFTNMCLEKENINAQCHSCNWTTWPRGSSKAKILLEEEYDKNLIKKYGEWVIEKLNGLCWEFTHRKASDPKKSYDFKKVIPQLIEENERLWASKSEEFRANHKPYRKWRVVWEDYDRRHDKIEWSGVRRI